MKKRWLILILLLAGLAGGFYLYFSTYNRLVLEKFQGMLWELPARVYARPLEIYPGMDLDPDLLEAELRLIGYRQVPGPGGSDESGESDEPGAPGQYVRTGKRFRLFCRAFDFGDQALPARRTEIRIRNNRVSMVRAPFAEKPSERLDPVLVGSFYPASMEDRMFLTPDQTPALLEKAIVCVEDKTFYSHYGIDPKSIFRAVLVNLKNRRLSQGGSTLTQQLAKNFFLTPEKTVMRKINEAFVAAALELNFTKEQILEAYMNEVFLGQDGRRAIHGFGLASRFYFGKSVSALEHHETALLVGLLKGPSAYNPRRHPERALTRRNTVLKLMAEEGLLSPAQLERSASAPLGIVPDPASGHSPFPHYLDLVKRQLLQEYRESDLRTAGLTIFTALDPQVQLAAEKSVTGFIGQKSLEAAVVVSSRASNEIQALVGGKKPVYGGFNRALDARRPIGSLVKPAVFLTALARPGTYTLVTPLDDSPVRVKNPDGSFWEPRNFDRRFHGRIPLYQALARSYNASTVRLGMDLGLESVLDTLATLGAPYDGEPFPAILLGSMEMSPFRVNQVFHTLAAGGFFSPARCIRSVYTLDGGLLRRYPLTIDNQMDPGVVFLLNKALQAAVKEGTAKTLGNWIPGEMGIAGKTGTTNDLRDSWFAGFSGNRLTVVWIGRDDNGTTGLTGATGALRIFGRLMGKIPNKPLDLVPPENIAWEVVHGRTGARTRSDCPDAMTVPFIKGSAPALFQGCETETRTGGESQKPKYLIDWLREIFK